MDEYNLFNKLREMVLNPKFDFRKLSTLAKNVGLEEKETKVFMEKYPYYFRKCLVNQTNGELIYTASERKSKFREYLALFQNILSR